MNQRDLNRAVARATGESVRTIADHGFLPLSAIPYERDAEPIDWDEREAQRNLILFPRRRRTALAI